MTRQPAPPEASQPIATVLSNAETAGLGIIHIDHPPGAFGPSPATRVAVIAISRHRARLSGCGVDWGCGPGTLAIACARVPTVSLVFGLDVNPINVAAAAVNGVVNGVSDKSRFAVANSFEPADEQAAAKLAEHRGRLDFVVANPPSSIGDDGFEFRRQVVRDALDWFRPGGVLFLNISQQYGDERVESLTDRTGFRPLGLLASSKLVPFDLERPDLRQALRDYRAEEARGGVPYAFPTGGGSSLSAIDALAHFNATGESPMTRWQVFGFERV